jgi:hypothetical protein
MSSSRRFEDTGLQDYEKFREPFFRFLTRLGLPSVQSHEITQECFPMHSQLLTGVMIAAPRTSCA